MCIQWYSTTQHIFRKTAPIASECCTYSSETPPHTKYMCNACHYAHTPAHGRHTHNTHTQKNHPYMHALIRTFSLILYTIHSIYYTYEAVDGEQESRFMFSEHIPHFRRPTHPRNTLKERTWQPLLTLCGASSSGLPMGRSLELVIYYHLLLCERKLSQRHPVWECSTGPRRVHVRWQVCEWVVEAVLCVCIMCCSVRQCECKCTMCRKRCWRE